MAFFSRPQTNAAVKIVNPTLAAEEKSKPQAKKDSTQRQCRNILIYGSCKYQDKGCLYYHPPATDNQNNSNLSDVSRTESPAPATLSAQAVNAPVFIPKSAVTSFSAPPATLPAVASSDAASPPVEYQDLGNRSTFNYDVPVNEVEISADDLSDDLQKLDTYIYDAPPENSQPLYHPEYHDPINSLGAYYAPSHATFIRQPLDYHLYTQPIPGNFSYFISDRIREELQQRSEVTRILPPPGLNLPEELQGYHTLVPLEPVVGDRRKLFNWFSAVYKATHSADGAAYVLRRVENFRLMHQTAFAAIEAWSRIKHPNIVHLREAFTTRSFNDNSLIVAYDYHPNASTLYETHFKPKAPSLHQGRLASSSNILSERTLWTYIIQIADAIRAAHEAGLAVRMIDATKILLTSKNRLRVSTCGLVDVLMYDARQDIGLLQQEDLAMFGRLIFSLCCKNLAAMSTLPKALDALSRQYSTDIKALAMYLISKPGPMKTISHVFDLIGRTRLINEMNEIQNSVDRLESEFMSELENGRLVRLLCKLGFINERPEFAHEPRWSETGDRYILKLFRDYVFHQVDENGSPVVDLTHVLTCLNKLDTGVEERIMLVSRDEQSCLVVSYKEVKSCIDVALSDLARGSESSRR